MCCHWTASAPRLSRFWLLYCTVCFHSDPSFWLRTDLERRRASTRTLRPGWPGSPWSTVHGLPLETRSLNLKTSQHALPVTSRCPASTGLPVSIPQLSASKRFSILPGKLFRTKLVCPTRMLSASAWKHSLRFSITHHASRITHHASRITPRSSSPASWPCSNAHSHARFCPSESARSRGGTASIRRI